MKLKLAILLLGAATGALSLTAPGVHAAGPSSCPAFFVSPHGSDQGPGTLRRPWRTIQHARDYIRARRPRLSCHVTVNLLAGVYRVSQPVTFTDQDSDATYRSYDGPGRAQLLGSQRVTGWRPTCTTGHPAGRCEARMSKYPPFRKYWTSPGRRRKAACTTSSSTASR